MSRITSFFAVDPRIGQSQLGWANIAIFLIAWKVMDLLVSARWTLQLMARRIESESVGLFFLQFELHFFVILLAVAIATRPSNAAHNRFWVLGFRSAAIKWYCAPLIAVVILVLLFFTLSWLFDPLGATPPPWQALAQLLHAFPPMRAARSTEFLLTLIVAVSLPIAIYGLLLPALLNQLKPVWAYTLAVVLGFAVIHSGNDHQTIVATMVVFVAIGPLLAFGCWVVARSGSVLPVLLGSIVGLPLILLALSVEYRW